MLRSHNYTRTDPDIEPVTVADVKHQLRIDHNEDDDDLADMIAEARAECEGPKLGDRALINGTCIDYLDTFDDEIELHWSPVVSITSVVYLDTDGASQTLASTVYEVANKNGMGVLRLKYGQSWVSVRSHGDVITVTYVAGYGAAASSVPLPARRWIKAKVAWLYENRDGAEFPFGLDGLLAPYATARVHA